MLKHLQKSVEEEELVWKSKMANSEEQLKEVTKDFIFILTLKTTSLSGVFKTNLRYLVTLPGFAESQ